MAPLFLLLTRVHKILSNIIFGSVEVLEATSGLRLENGAYLPQPPALASPMTSVKLLLLCGSQLRKSATIMVPLAVGSGDR